MTPQTADATAFALSTPEDEALFWQHDAMHFPDPLAPMESAFLERTLGRGFAFGARAYNAPLQSVEIRTVNGYEYQSMVPMTGTPDEMAAQGALAEAAVREVLGRIGELWTDEILPEIHDHLGFWDSFDLEGATRAAFAAHLEETWERLARVWQLHFLIVLPSYLAMSEFDEMYRGLFPDAGALDSYRLLEGLENMTVEVGLEQWRLSRRALAEPVVADVLLTRPASEVPAALRESAEGRAFLAELDALPRSLRSSRRQVDDPRAELDRGPDPAIENLRDFVRRPDTDAPTVTTEDAAAKREQAIAEARERLRDYPAPIVGQFEGMLAAAQASLVISEDHNFWIDNMSIHHLRQVLLAAGRRLVADGAIADANDVFMLDPEQLAAAIDAPGEDLRPVIDARTADMRRQRDLVPPPVLGTIPTAPPPDDPFTRVAMKFNGVPQAPEAEGELRGSAGSRASCAAPRASSARSPRRVACSRATSSSRRRPRRRGRRCSRRSPRSSPTRAAS